MRDRWGSLPRDRAIPFRDHGAGRWLRALSGVSLSVAALVVACGLAPRSQGLEATPPETFFSDVATGDSAKVYCPQLRRADTLTSGELRQSPPIASPRTWWRPRSVGDAPTSSSLFTSPVVTGSTSDTIRAATATTATATPIDLFTFSVKLRLDRAFFSPTLVDDQRWDRRYRKATRAYQIAHGLQVDGIAGPETSASLRRFAPLTTPVVVREEDFAALRPVPRAKDYPAMARLDFLGHRTAREALAERFHTTEGFLERLNPHVDWSVLAPGDVVTVPNIRRRPPPFYAARVEVDVAERHVRVFDDQGRMRAHFNCSVGTDADVYESLELEVINTVEWPNYTLDPRLFGLTDQISGKLLLAHGPNNPVGRAWVGLSRPGYGIHGTPDPEDIGHTRSHGCIRLSNWDALTFAHMIKVGTPVRFLGLHWPAEEMKSSEEDSDASDGGEQGASAPDAIGDDSADDRKGDSEDGRRLERGAGNEEGSDGGKSEGDGGVLRQAPPIMDDIAPSTGDAPGDASNAFR